MGDFKWWSAIGTEVDLYVTIWQLNMGAGFEPVILGITSKSPNHYTNVPMTDER